MSEPVCPDCLTPLRPAGDAWYCHACLGDDSAASASESGGEPGGRRGLAGKLARGEVSGDE